MLRLVSILSTFLLLSESSLYSHSYYVSTAQMEYNSETKTIDVSVKMTAHDFEQMLETKFNQRIHIEHVSDTSEAGKYIIDYLGENFTLSSGAKQAGFLFIGKEVTLRDELFFYFSFTDIANPASVHIKNTLLFLQFSQQQNIVSYRYGDKTVSVTLVSGKSEALLEIN